MIPTRIIMPPGGFMPKRLRHECPTSWDEMARRFTNPPDIDSVGALRKRCHGDGCMPGIGWTPNFRLISNRVAILQQAHHLPFPAKYPFATARTLANSLASQAGNHCSRRC